MYVYFLAVHAVVIESDMHCKAHATLVSEVNLNQRQLPCTMGWQNCEQYP